MKQSFVYFLMMWAVLATISWSKLWFDDPYTYKQLLGQISFILILGFTMIYYKIGEEK
ncbi:MAG: hypothetical protein KJI71_01360 [Patescibacteria group bacterium]|nr:hypothetical protein [Patescibacteria group bacterium]